MVNLIAHGLIVQDEKVLLIKRSKIKRGIQNYNPERWDIPGGTVEYNETLRNAIVREVKEETNCTTIAGNILYDMYQYDVNKNKEYLTLVYKMKIVDCSDIRIDEEEHTEYRWVNISDIFDSNLSIDLLEYIIPALKCLK